MHVADEIPAAVEGQGLTYPAPHFPGTPILVRRAVRRAMDRAGVTDAHRPDWRVALEAMARYESNCTTPTTGSTVCPGCRGMMQCATGQYDAAVSQRYIVTANYASRVQAVIVAIHYIRSELPGYGGYGDIDTFLASTDRGPGELLRAWVANPDATIEELRPFYNGY